MERILPRRIVRIADRLSALPVELIEPVLADLPLHRVLDLLAVEHSTTYTSYRSGPLLGPAICGSSAWSMLGHTSLRRLGSLWCAFNQLSLLSEGRLLAASECKPQYLEKLCSNINMTGQQLQQNLEEDLKTSFFDVLIIKERFRDNGTTLKALCVYLPESTKGLSTFCYVKTVSVIRSKSAQWTTDDCIDLLQHLFEAEQRLNKDKAAELRRLADLYERYPTYLKMAEAPQSPRQNLQHIPQQLRSRARRPGHPLFAFRYAHSVLVPYDWCFRLFDAVAEQVRHKDTDNVVGWQKAKDGMNGIVAPKMDRRPPRLTSSRRQVIQRKDNIMPTFVNELAWLESFLHAIQWIENEFPASVVDFKVAAVLDTPLADVLLEAADFQNFVQNSKAADVVKQLRADHELSKQERPSQLPSLVALHMPHSTSSRAKNIARHLWPGQGRRPDVCQLLYEQMIATIKTTLARGPEAEDYDGQGEVQEYAPPKRGGTADRARTCYICHMILNQPHKTLKSMCGPCGDFNLAERGLSAPENLSLGGKTALLTGGRINLGYHTVLRLLRCGAFVIASSRYPEDALSRYKKELDFEIWSDRLRIVGSDFRTAGDAFALVEVAKAILQQEQRKLDILINNAAQTLTDPIEMEIKAIERERLLVKASTDKEVGKQVVIHQGYTARVRGGTTNVPHGLSGGDIGLVTNPSSASTSSIDAPMTNLQISGPSTPSSWVQSLSNIPYEDVITAHSVNTFVPLILVRELLPLMHGGHIINVSSREGIFEFKKDSSAKNGKHVHTNMSKAGLNMITETEAATAWKQRKVAMNTVDPGYMSAAPELEDSHCGERPIGWDDGAGRVLWPVAKREGGKTVWGRFLKHYGAVRVDTRLGRG